MKKRWNNRYWLVVIVLLIYMVSYSIKHKGNDKIHRKYTKQNHVAWTATSNPKITKTVASNGEIIEGDTTLLECPRLHGDNANYFVTHWASGRVNYSVEYDVTKHDPRWVCFTFDDITCQRNHHGRSEGWVWDPDIPATYDTSSWYRHSGYDRGHMTASNDRQYSAEANAETFYYSNVYPQLHKLNAGIWERLERKVQSWGANSQMRDVIYVAKGGTIEDGQVFSQKLRGKMVIPKYFWMALVAKKGNTYHGIAFWVEHKNYTDGERIKDLAISIDQLEKRTGLDLFHNLPDDIEQQVEAENPNSNTANKYWWRY